MGVGTAYVFAAARFDVTAVEPKPHRRRQLLQVLKAQAAQAVTRGKLTRVKLGIRTGIDLDGILAAAEDVAAPLLPVVPTIDRDAITLGTAGVYSSFLKHARHIGARYEVSPSELLREAGRRKLVGGQEDLLVDIAVACSEQATRP